MPLSLAIESVSVVDAIESRLKDMIMNGILKPGEQLPSERELQVSLKVSRLPLREALARLQALGLIDIRHGKGAYVEKSVSQTALSDVLIPFFPNQSTQGLRELVEARGFLESELTALATLKATEADLDRVDELAGFDLQTDQGVEAFADADYLFHHEVARIAGNNFLAMMHEAIAPHIRSFLVAYAEAEKDRAVAVQRNRQLARAIRAGDPRAAAQMAREHLVPCLKVVTTVSKRTAPQSS